MTSNATTGPDTRALRSGNRKRTDFNASVDEEAVALKKTALETSDGPPAEQDAWTELNKTVSLGNKPGGDDVPTDEEAAPTPVHFRSAPSSPVGEHGTCPEAMATVEAGREASANGATGKAEDKPKAEDFGRTGSFEVSDEALEFFDTKDVCFAAEKATKSWTIKDVYMREYVYDSAEEPVQIGIAAELIGVPNHCGRSKSDARLLLGDFQQQEQEGKPFVFITQKQVAKGNTGPKNHCFVLPSSLAKLLFVEELASTVERMGEDILKSFKAYKNYKLNHPAQVAIQRVPSLELIVWKKTSAGKSGGRRGGAQPPQTWALVIGLNLLKYCKDPSIPSLKVMEPRLTELAVTVKLCSSNGDMFERGSHPNKNLEVKFAENNSVKIARSPRGLNMDFGTFMGMLHSAQYKDVLGKLNYMEQQEEVA